VLSLAILPIFIMAIDYGFIGPEEDRLRRKFRSDFERYMRDTRRWI
jgi:protein-S-isoprenylcysteine O-methyltransferase Ste14